MVWGAFRGGYANPRSPEGARLVALAIAEGVPLRELRDGVEPEGAIPNIKPDAECMAKVQTNTARMVRIR